MAAGSANPRSAERRGFVNRAAEIPAPGGPLFARQDFAPPSASTGGVIVGFLPARAVVGAFPGGALPDSIGRRPTTPPAGAIFGVGAPAVAPGGATPFWVFAVLGAAAWVFVSFRVAQTGDRSLGQTKASSCGTQVSTSRVRQNTIHG